MDTLFDAHDINPAVRRIIRSMARTLKGTAGYTRDDVDDITQELIHHLLTHPIQVDEERGRLTTVVRRMLNRKIAHMIEARHAAKRDVRRCRASLDDPVDLNDNEAATVREVYDMNAYLELTGKNTRSLEDLVMLVMRIETVLDSLPPQLRTIAEMLKEHTKSETARELGIPWSSLCDACQQLRRIFAAHNLEDCL